jgi:hypothetical protein
MKLILDFPDKVAESLATLKLWAEKNNAQIIIYALALLDLVRKETDKGAKIIIRYPDGTESILNMWEKDK